MWSLTAAAETFSLAYHFQRAAVQRSANSRSILLRFANGHEFKSVPSKSLQSSSSNMLPTRWADPTLIRSKSLKSKKPVFDILRRLEAGEFPSFISQVNGRNLLHHEILSVAQVAVRSPEVARLSAWRESAA